VATDPDQFPGDPGLNRAEEAGVERGRLAGDPSAAIEKELVDLVTGFRTDCVDPPTDGPSWSVMMVAHCPPQTRSSCSSGSGRTWPS
jgi:hypothetical protein